MESINTQKEYQEYVDKKSPNSPIWKNCLNAFWVGGLICSIGQFIMEICKYRNNFRTGLAVVPNEVIDNQFRRYNTNLKGFDEVWEINMEGEKVN